MNIRGEQAHNGDSPAALFGRSSNWNVDLMFFLKSPLTVLAVSALALSACSDLQDPNNPNRNTQQGALIGAAAGALVGIAAGDSEEERRRGAVIGGLIGAGGGAAIGNQLDQQEAALRSQLGGNVGINNTGDQLIVTLPQDILFATGSATLTGGLRADLAALARNLNEYPNTRVNVIGHTDNVGDAGFNQGLSEQRAQSVAQTLIGSGVSAGRVNAFGRGESSPVADNLTPGGRQQNRRVEIVITPF